MKSKFLIFRFNAILGFILLLSIVFVFSSCNSETKTPENKPKYIFLFIGDGMGFGNVSIAEAFLSIHDGTTGFKRLNFTEFPVHGDCTTYCADNLITDSGAAGSAIACGEKANFSTISYYPQLQNPPLSIAKIAKQNGFKVGIITTVGINHATPAVFYANNKNRRDYYNIGLQLCESGFDFFGGGGFLKPNDKSNDKRSLYEITQENAYVITNSIDNWKDLVKDKKGLYFTNPVLLDEADMPYAIDRKKLGGFSLAEIVEKAIDFLFNEKGFFIMVEGGKIDWAAHENDPATLALEVIDFDLAVKKALEFYHKYPEQTLIIVTADHDTGGISIGNYEKEYQTNLSLLLNYKHSLKYFSGVLDNYKEKNKDYSIQEVLKLADENFYSPLPYFSKNDMIELKSAFDYYFFTRTNLSEEELRIKYDEYNPVAVAISKVIIRNIGLNFSTWNHLANKVPVYTIGKGAEYFGGSMDNTEFKPKILNLMQW